MGRTNLVLIKNNDRTESYNLSLKIKILENVGVETKKANEFLQNIPTHITDLNESLNAGAKLINDKIRIPPQKKETEIQIISPGSELSNYKN